MSIDSISFSKINDQQITANYSEGKVVAPQKEKKISIFEVSDEELEQDILKLQYSKIKQKSSPVISNKAPEENIVVIKRTKERKLSHLHFSTKKSPPEAKPTSLSITRSLSAPIPRTISPPPLLTRFKGKDLSKLRFSQKTINHQLSTQGSFLFKNPIQGSKEQTLFTILQKEGWKPQYKIDVVFMPDESYTSLDNRRLAVAKAINTLFPNTICVHASPHHHSDKADSALMNRVCPPGVLPPLPSTEKIEKNTHGHAILVRMNEPHHSSSELYGFNDYPILITGLHGKGKRRIAFGQSDVKLEALSQN